MKRFLIGIVLLFFACELNAQNITDTAMLRASINAWIIPKGAITSTKLNLILNGFMNVPKADTATSTTAGLLTPFMFNKIGTGSSGPGGGISSLSIATTNGFSGSSSGGLTPVITLTTPITGLLKGNGTAISAAIAGTDYLLPTGSAASLTGFPALNQNTTGTAAGLSANIAESQVTNLTADLAGKQNVIGYTPYNSTNPAGYITTYTESDPIIRAINGVIFSNGTTIRAAVLGDFPTLNQNTTGTAAGLSANIVESQVTNLTTDLGLKAPLASPSLTGTPSAPTATVGTNTTQIATTAFVLANAGGSAAYGERFTGSTSLTITLAHNYKTGTIRLYKNGPRLDQTVDFTEATSNTLTLNVARLSGDVFLIDYNY